MTSSANPGALVGLALKNSVLVVLLILIAHVVAKGQAPSVASPPQPVAMGEEQRRDAEAPVPANSPVTSHLASKACQGSKKKSALLAVEDTDDSEADALRAYVFGAAAAEGPAPQLQQAATKQEAALSAAAMPATTAGQLVINKYDNEHVMCGGTLFDNGLLGFDGFGTGAQFEELSPAS